MERLISRTARVALLLLSLLPLLPAHAADERFDYDESGRLIRAVDDTGAATRYIYDSVGNLLQVLTGESAAAPAVSSLTPATFRHETPVTVTAGGSGLLAVRVTASDPGIRVEDVHTLESVVTFTLRADRSVALGTHTLTFENALGRVERGIDIRPEAPIVSVTPYPLAAPPGGATRAFLLRHSHADTVDHTYTLTVEDETIATVGSASLTVAAGETEVRGDFTGHKEGITYLRLTSAELPEVVVPVYVTAEFAGVNTSHADLLGVTVTPPFVPAPPFIVDGLQGSGVGVVHGRAVVALDPATVTVGGVEVPLILRGAGLEGVDTVTLHPADGLTIGAVTPAADGNSVTVPVTVADNAPIGMRILTATAAGAPIPAVAGADRLLVTLPPPVVESVSPLYRRVGGEGGEIVIRGRHFKNVVEVRVTPADAIEVDGTPQVNEAGSELRVGLSVAPNAAPGARVVSVVTRGGVSSDQASPYNTLHITLDEQQVFENLNGPLVGVVVEAPVVPVSRDAQLIGAQLGVVHGAAVTALEPAKGIIGRELTLTLRGGGLEGVTEVRFEPADGISQAGDLTVATDGTRVTLPLAIAADAPQTLRTVTVLAGAAVLPAAEGAGRFRVTAPPPVVESVSPLYLTPGATVNLTVRGRDLQGASAARLLPAAGITIGQLVPAADGRSLIVPLVVAADAPLGPRTIQVATPGGDSSAVPDQTNTLWVESAALATYSDINAPLLGVMVGEPPAPEPVVSAIHSAHLGVVVEEVPAESAANDAFMVAPELGVAVGPFARTSAPDGVLAGGEVTVTVTGEALGSVATVELDPVGDFTVGAPSVAPDGRSLTFTASAAAGAAPQSSRLRLIDASGAAVPFLAPGNDYLHIVDTSVAIHSIEPILAGQGDAFTLLVRGVSLRRAIGIAAAPAEGVGFEGAIQVNEAGTELTVPLRVSADAPLGPRVIQVLIPGGATSAVAEPANTFTVYESVPK